jgi:alanine dehydrogenase
MTSTYALTNVTLPYVRKLAADPVGAVRADAALREGVNTWKGKLTCRPVAEAQNLAWTDVTTLI